MIRSRSVIAHRQSLSGKVVPVGLLLTTLLLTSCWNKNDAAPAVQAPPPTQGTQVVGEAYGLNLSGKLSTAGFSRYTVRLTGGAGPGTALIRFALPDGLRIVAAQTQNGVIQVQGDTAIILTNGTSTATDFDIQGETEGIYLTARLEEAVSVGRQLEVPLSATTFVQGPGVELPSLSAPVNTEPVVNTEPGTPDSAEVTTEISLPTAKFSNFLLATAQSEKLTSQTTPTIQTFPVQAQALRPWLAFEAGDVDKNGKITLDDILLLTNTLLGSKKLDDSQKFLADLKDDGKVTADDLAVLVLKRLTMALGGKTTVPLPSVHAKTYTLDGSLATLSVGNAGTGSVSAFKVTASVPWVVLKPITSGVHVSALAFDISKTPDAPAAGTASITVEGKGQKRTVALQALRSLADSTQDTTAAGTDADKNGIRDEVDVLINKDFRESPLQYKYAQLAARAMQISASTVEPSRERAIEIMENEYFAKTCLIFNTSNSSMSTMLAKINGATFNNYARLKNSEDLGAKIGNYYFKTPKASECK